MPSLGYMPTFAKQVLSKTKPHSIRAKRAIPIKPGDRLYHFTGLRTKNCQRLGESKCLNTCEIMIYADLRQIQIKSWQAPENDAPKPYTVGILSSDEAMRLMLDDGFANDDLFWKFFSKNNSGDFMGQLIYWGDTFVSAQP